MSYPYTRKPRIPWREQAVIDAARALVAADAKEATGPNALDAIHANLALVDAVAQLDAEPPSFANGRRRMVW